MPLRNSAELAQLTLFPRWSRSIWITAWEQRKFSELYVVNNERNESCEFGYDKTLSVATMTYNGGNGAADNSLSTYKVVRVGDIAFEGHTNKEHAYGRFVLNDAGDGLMSPRFSCLRPIVEQRYSFWKHYIPRESMMRPVLVNATKSGTMMNELVPADLMRESFLVPVLYEQEAIGRFFKQLDDLITLHQCKRQHCSLCGYLSWEQRKLGELMDVTSVRRVHQEDWTDEGVRFLRARDLVAFARNEPIDDPLFISEEMYQEYSAQSGKVSVGDLLVTGVGTIGVPWLVTSENPIYFKDGNIIWFKNAGEIDGEFFFHSFIAGAIQSYINEAAGIGTVGTYTIDTGKKTPIWLPAKQEQRCVAALMTRLDSLITLHR